MNTLSALYHFVAREKHWQLFWEEKKIYTWEPTEKRTALFSVDTPPPSVSGALHIGHTYSYAQADFIVRFQRMLGKKIFYPMGFDDNGLPTERLVEKKKSVSAVRMAREDFIQLCQEVIVGEEEKFRHLFKAMALSVDWDLTYQTISPQSCKLSQMSFLALLSRGEIYRSEEPILWDPVDGTALSQADIEEKARTAYIYTIPFFHAATQQPLPIATTRPELLPACVALFYHPDDPRYQYLAGSYATDPLFQIKVPILADSQVKPEKGTGLVMCATFGDQQDISWWRQHRLPATLILNKQGIITVHGPLQGLSVAAARAKVIQLLQEQGLLIQQHTIQQLVKCAERSGAPLEILTVPQWFVRVLAHKQALLDRADQLQWHPPTMKNRLITWIEGISWDWCISRQRYFGIPFPIWYAKRKGEEGKVIMPSIDQLPLNPIENLPMGYSREEVLPDYDVMDTWATSSISPQLSTHAIDSGFNDYARHQQLFPMDLRTQGHDIIRTWTFYTLLKTHLHEDKLPWQNIMIHGWCLTSDHHKMSKSKGNLILPETLLAQYGADVIRYWSAMARLGSDTCYCENVMKNGKRLVTKLWNAGKLVEYHSKKMPIALLTATLSVDCVTHTLDRWLLQVLSTLIQGVTNHFLAYNYTEALLETEKFFWSIFCDDYIEISKTRSYQPSATHHGAHSAILTLYHSFYIILQLFAPIVPHITEELAQGLYPHRGSIHQRGNWPIWPLSISLNQNQWDQIYFLREVMGLVRKTKADKKLSVKAPIQHLSIEGVILEEDLLQELKNATAAATIGYGALPLEGVTLTGKYGSVGIVFPSHT